MIWGRSVQAKASVRTKAWGGGACSPVCRGAQGVQGKWWPLKQEKQVGTRSWSFALSPSTSVYWMLTVYRVWAGRTRKEFRAG